MRGLLTSLSVRRVKRHWLPWRNTYELLKPLKYKGKDGRTHIVPAGFLTNFATWIKPRGKYDEAAVVHDYLYGIGAKRHYSDRIFGEMMRRGGCGQLRINSLYYGVRLFGWWAYYGKRFMSYIMEHK